MPSQTTRIVAIGTSPSTDEATTSFRLLLRQLHLRSDVELSVVWLESGTERDAWRTYAARQLVFDDLRTWAPASLLERVAPTAAGRLRGLRARAQFAQLRQAEVAILQEGVGAHLLHRLPSVGVRVATWHRRSPSSSSPRVATADLVVVERDAPAPAVDGPVVQIPPPYDGRTARAWGIDRSLRPRTTPLVVGLSTGRSAEADLARLRELAAQVAGSGGDLPRAALVLRPDDLPEGSVPQPIDDDDRVQTPEDAATADLFVVLAPGDHRDPNLLDALAAGTPVADATGTPDPHLPAELLVDLPTGERDESAPPPFEGWRAARGERMAMARDACDVAPAAEMVWTRILALLGRS
jgi:hypothetical protein